MQGQNPIENHLNVISQALNKANQAGAFSLQDSAVIAQSLGAVLNVFKQPEPNPIEEAREEAKEKVTAKKKPVRKPTKV